MAFFNEEMDNRDIFLAYLVNAEKGLFESGNFCLEDNDYYILFKKVIKDYDSLALYEKYKCRLWGIYIRELVYRYAQSYQRLWPDLKAGLNADVQMLLNKYCNDENEKNSVKAGKGRFDEDNEDIQGFCYDGGGEALQKIFNGWNFENTEYHFQNRLKSSANRRYLEFLLKLSVLPANYLPTHGIYGLLRDAFVKSRCPYWSNESPSKIFLSKLQGVLTNAGDGWKVHRNTIEAFRDRMLDFFTFVFSWKSCGYSYEDAKEALGQTFVFLSQKKENNYLYTFLQEEYGLQNRESIDKATVQKCSKKLFQFNYVLDKRISLFYFKKTQGNIKFHLSTYLDNRNIRGIKQSIVIKVGNDEIAKINLNGALVFANGGSVQNENLSILKLIKEKEISLVWDDNVLPIKNPWYTPNCWFLLNTFGTDSAKTWDVRNDAYLAIPKEMGRIECGEEALAAQQLSQEKIELLLPESANSGLDVYKLHASPNVNQEQVLFNTSNGYCIEIKLRDVDYVRTIPNFKGAPTFVQQNLHSKIAIGQIGFEWPNYEDFSNFSNGVRFTARNGNFIIKNESQNIICLDEQNPTLKAMSDLLRKKFPYIVLLPSNAKIWISEEERVKMCHWFAGNKQLDGFALYGNHDSIKISNASIEPSEWLNDNNVFRLTEPKWNDLLLKDNCSSEELGRLSSWVEPEFPEADLYFRWNEGNIPFEVNITSEEKKRLEELYGEKCGRGLASIYRLLKISGADVTVGFSFEGKRFVKRFNQCSNYKQPERSIKYSYFWEDKKKCGEFLKNSLLNRNEIIKRCRIVKELNQEKYGYYMPLNPEDYDSGDAVNRELILNCKPNETDRIPFINKKIAAIGEMKFVDEKQMDFKLVQNESKSILYKQGGCFEKENGRWLCPDVILFPKNTNVCVLLNEEKYYLLLTGDVENLSKVWKYDINNNIHYIILNDYFTADGIPITDDIRICIDFNSLRQAEKFQFITAPDLQKVDHVWFKYNQTEEYETALPDVLSKGLALILHAIPINDGSFEFMVKKGECFFYNVFKEFVPLPHRAEHDEEKITTYLYDHKPIPYQTLFELQSLLGIKSVNLVLEYIALNCKEEQRFLFRWICGLRSLDLSESYALKCIGAIVEGSYFKAYEYAKGSNVQSKEIWKKIASLGYKIVKGNQEYPHSALLDSLTTRNGFIQCFYEGVKWAINLWNQNIEMPNSVRTCKEMFEKYKTLKLVNCDPQPVGSWKILWSVRNIENGKTFVSDFLSSLSEISHVDAPPKDVQISEERVSEPPVESPLNRDENSKTYDEKKLFWEKLLHKYGVPEADLSKKKYKFEPFYYRMKDELLEARAKMLAGR